VRWMLLRPRPHRHRPRDPPHPTATPSSSGHLVSLVLFSVPTSSRSPLVTQIEISQGEVARAGQGSAGRRRSQARLVEVGSGVGSGALLMGERGGFLLGNGEKNWGRRCADGLRRSATRRTRAPAAGSTSQYAQIGQRRSQRMPVKHGAALDREGRRPRLWRAGGSAPQRGTKEELCCWQRGLAGGREAAGVVD
jgi:hypothetical protein